MKTTLAARVPLRFSLVAVVVALMALGLLVSGVAVTAAMHDRLLSREDQTLRQAAGSWARPSVLQMPPPAPGKAPPTRFFVATFLSDGRAVQMSNPDFDAQPDLTAIGDLGDAAVTVQSYGGEGPKWRVVQSQSRDHVTYVAVTLTDLESTIDALVTLEVFIGVVVLIVAGGVGYLVVRRSLRPLEQVEATAEAIAAGDLTRRVPDAPRGTEVGRLSYSLNTMLRQVQDSFDRVAKSEEQARADEQRMRQFVGDASHELRTPLTSIRGFAELYRQGASTDPELIVSRIEAEAQRMGLLVEDLLLLARLDARRPLMNESVDLAETAAEVVHAAQVRQPERDITLSTDGAVEVAGDRDRLHQVITNLVSNALRHTGDDASVHVEVGADTGGAKIVVADTGPGMSADDAHRIFERFYRTDSSRSRGSGGAGLGLSIVRSIVERHGGTVSVITAPGAGARFVVHFPG